MILCFRALIFQHFTSTFLLLMSFPYLYKLNIFNGVSLCCPCLVGLTHIIPIFLVTISSGISFWDYFMFYWTACFSGVFTVVSTVWIGLAMSSPSFWKGTCCTVNKILGWQSLLPTTLNVLFYHILPSVWGYFVSRCFLVLVFIWGVLYFHYIMFSCGSLFFPVGICFASII